MFFNILHFVWIFYGLFRAIHSLLVETRNTFLLYSDTAQNQKYEFAFFNKTNMRFTLAFAKQRYWFYYQRVNFYVRRKVHRTWILHQSSAEKPNVFYESFATIDVASDRFYVGSRSKYPSQNQVDERPSLAKWSCWFFRLNTAG